MVNAQTWLDNNCPKETRNKVETIYLNEQLTGELNLEDFINLKKVYISARVDKNNFSIKNERWNTDIIRCIPAQQWLDTNYPKQKRIQITDLNISGKNLEGDLKLTGFFYLKEFQCSHNQITSLDLTDCLQLEEIWCHDNQLTDLNIAGLTKITKIGCANNKIASLDFLKNLNPARALTLRMENNKFPAQNLSCFERFTSLQILYVDNNLFRGSLNHLRNLTQLKELGITNTNINEGLEHLPESFFEDFLGMNFLASKLNLTGGYFKKILRCNGKIAEELENYKIEDDPLKNYDFRAWRRDYLARKLEEETKKARLFEDNSQKEENLKLQKQLKETKKELTNKEKELKELPRQDITPLLVAKESAWQQKYQAKQQEIKELQTKIKQLEKEIIDNANLKEKPRATAKRQIQTITETSTSTNSPNWNNIHHSFTPNLINNWKISSFTYQQTQEWINIGLQPNDWAFCWWLKNYKKLTAERVLNSYSLEQLKTEHQQFKAQIQVPPK